MKALAYEIPKFFQGVRIILIDFQVGTQAIAGQALYSVFRQFGAVPQPMTRSMIASRS
ncbi:MAG: hypothetical protein PUP93_24095 [Rhizonema sp. NSF051]|nr:hypothetical protein [Rhizonema sp. NSF051]